MGIDTADEKLTVECQTLLSSFFQALDAGDPGACAFVHPDFVWHRQGKVLRGPQAIGAVLQARPADRLVRHLFSNFVVTGSSDGRAKSKAYYTVYAHEGAERPGVIRGPERVGDYHAEFIRSEDGWRIASLRAERLFSAH
jgi:hypothetical protein